MLNGTNGAVVWSAPTSGQVIGSPVTADLTGGGYQDVIVPTTNGIDIYDGRSGAEVDTLGVNEGFQNSPFVTDDPNGHIGITGAGFRTPVAPTSASTHWEIDNTSGSGSTVNERARGPSSITIPQLTGDAGTPAPTSRCHAMHRGAPDGYILSASDGGMFNYGNIPFCGSTGSIHLNKTVVGSALTRTAGGTGRSPRTAASSPLATPPFTGPWGQPAERPIVGMAATPDSGGYWEVASDGGIFNFGNAHSSAARAHPP